MSPPFPRLRVPLVERSVRGRRCDRAELMIRVRLRPPGANPEAERPFTFIVDTGSDATVVPAWLAERHHIPFVRAPRPDVLTGLGGQLGGSWGAITLFLVEEWITLPRFFHASPAPSSVEAWEKQLLRERSPPKLVLGRAGILDRFGIRIASGHLTIARQSGAP